MSTTPLHTQRSFADEAEVLLREMPSVRDPSIKCVAMEQKFPEFFHRKKC